MTLYLINSCFYLISYLFSYTEFRGEDTEKHGEKNLRISVKLRASSVASV